jgi:Xaa-Pro dipeptidase
MKPMKKTPKDELQYRIKTLQRGMESESIDGVLIVQNADLFYFAGTVQQAYLFIPSAGAPLFFVRKNAERVRQESALDTIIPLHSLRDLPKRLADHGYERIHRLGMELDVLPVNHYFLYKNAVKPGEIVDIWPLIRVIRAVKSEYEIGIMRETAVLSDFIVETCRNNLREGLRDIELAAIVEAAARARGHHGFVRTRTFNQEVYWGHLISGPDAAEIAYVDGTTGGRGLGNAFPQGSGWRTIGRHEPVIVDLCAVMDGYHIDQTRTLAIGALPGKLDEAYNVALEIAHELEEMISPDVKVGELYEKATHMAESHHLGEHFMGYGAQRIGYCGHGIGLELDEFPVIGKGQNAVLSSGMSIAVEPKFHFPGEGVVGVEDTFVVIEGGCEKLTHSSYGSDVTKE